MIAAFALVLAVVISPLASPTVPGCWRPPVDAPVTRPYAAPACTWCAGHRGIEYRIVGNAQVRNVVAGTVTYAGAVAGTRYAVVQLADGRKVTYGLLADIGVRAGQRVAAGEPMGQASGRLFFGVRSGGRPVDPAPLLCHRGHVRLVQVAG